MFKQLLPSFSVARLSIAKKTKKTNKAEVLVETPPQEDNAANHLASRLQFQHEIEEEAHVARSNNECLISIPDKGSHGPAIVRAC